MAYTNARQVSQTFVASRSSGCGRGAIPVLYGFTRRLADSFTSWQREQGETTCTEALNVVDGILRRQWDAGPGVQDVGLARRPGGLEPIRLGLLGRLQRLLKL